YEAAAYSTGIGYRRAPATDADAAAARRGRLGYLARDATRNDPLAARALQVITNNVVGDGIIPRPDPKHPGLVTPFLELTESFLDTTSIDANGLQNLYGLQRLVMSTVAAAGEAIVLRHPAPPGAPGLPLRLQVLEPDHLDMSRDSMAKRGGGYVHEGISYDQKGRRTGYWLYDHHPGSTAPHLAGARSRFWPARDVLHVYRPDRPGQMRGVSWFAPIILDLQHLSDYAEAQLMRQKIAACFAGFRTITDHHRPDRERELEALSPGLIQDLGPDEEITFTDPPEAGDYDPFVRAIVRHVAAGLGITYEALSGDLSTVNFSSARMGRMEMDRNISAWQWTMLIPAMLQPLGQWIVAAWAQTDARVARLVAEGKPPVIGWVPPHRVLVDPTREIPALREAVAAGFTSRRAVVRSLGHDPERLEQDIAGENAVADKLGLVFLSDGRVAATAAAEPSQEGRNDA
ncbi:MAG TPA: phage portal protein, partial [Paracoccaceae bacterium]|nr:phage portal protein [Paracoccaceae bacterium]